jgi:GntR family transcriptional regulator
MSASLPLPKYHQIYLVLREQLQEGRFADGLPGELALAGQFGVARVTVRKALEQLSSEGLIDRAPGRGTRPRQKPVAAAPRGGSGTGAGSRMQLTGLLENIVTMGLRTQVQVVSCELITSSPEVAQALDIVPGARVQKAVRVRSTGEGPLSVITTHVPEPLARGFGRKELARQPILLLREASGVRIGRAVQSLSARLADAVVAKQLDVQVGSALLAVTRLIYDEQDRPVQWLHGLYRPDRYQYQMQLSRVGGIDAKLWVSTELSAQFH